MHSTTMFKSMRQLIVLFFFITASTTAFPIHHHRQKTETISGQIVAYSSGFLCFNGNGDWSMIIRVQPHKNIPSRLIKVDFSYPCGKSPDVAWAQSQVKRFRLYRQRDYDAVLDGEMTDDAEQKFKEFNVSESEHCKSCEYIKDCSIKDCKIINIPILPIWHYPPGVEPFTLPFGQILPCYHSLDFPYLPVL